MATTTGEIEAADGAVGHDGVETQEPIGVPVEVDRVLLAVADDTHDRVRNVALSMAATHGATVDALSVIPMDVSVDHWDMVVERRESAAEAVLDAAGAAADAASVPLHKRLRYGTPAEEISLYADGNDVDLIVVGEPNRTGLRRFFSPKNVASDVRAATGVPVVSVPQVAESAE
ncbi:universal stress protein [Halobaculum limi]|uniref:universal stress protein n=1 Tax=Halobaculum limi TaxID=3031916 RepID=UPI002407235D|nr:universal stress protein [Halobaculum sp. YSMS11]